MSLFGYLLGKCVSIVVYVHVFLSDTFFLSALIEHISLCAFLEFIQVFFNAISQKCT